MLLEVDNITKFYPEHTQPVLQNVTFSVNEGAKIGIVGKSGSGKTTLVRIIANLESADKGSIIFNGAKIDFSQEAKRSKQIQKKQIHTAWMSMQMVFQNPLKTFSNYMNISEAIWEGATYHPSFSHYSKHEKERKITNTLEEVGLSKSFAKKHAFELSGGECQRAAIARAIIGNPKLIICDEATSALDVTVQARIMNLLEKLHEEKGMAFIFVSHNTALVQSFCDHIYSL